MIFGRTIIRENKEHLDAGVEAMLKAIRFPLSAVQLQENWVCHYAERAAHELVYKENILTESATEFDRHRVKREIEKRIHRAIISYIDAVRQRADAEEAKAPQEVVAS